MLRIVYIVNIVFLPEQIHVYMLTDKYTLSIIFIVVFLPEPMCVSMLTDKCKAPYYGGCAHTRECVSTVEGATCGNCHPGYARDPRNYTIGECLGISQSAYSAHQ